MKTNGNEIYAGNQVTEELVLTAQRLLNQYGTIDVNFSVEGRTFHQILSHQLYEQLDKDEYTAEITYNYGCKIFVKKRVTLIVVEIKYVNFEGKDLVVNLKRAFTEAKEAEVWLHNYMLTTPDIKKVLGMMYEEGDKFVDFGDISIEMLPID